MFKKKKQVILVGQRRAFIQFLQFSSVSSAAPPTEAPPSSRKNCLYLINFDGLLCYYKKSHFSWSEKGFTPVSSFFFSFYSFFSFIMLFHRLLVMFQFVLVVWYGLVNVPGLF